MNYEEALEYLNSQAFFGSKLGLSRIKKLCEIMGNPQKKLKYVHIAGTNGKGSTSSLIFHVLKESGLKTGLFTSPYIQRFTERIKVNDDEISKDQVAKIMSDIRDKIENTNFGDNNPTWFEIITVMGFIHYAQQNCDIVVLEVGLGGDLDSTNIIDQSEVSVITSINYDHMEVLGSTIEEIAKAKAGIIKPNGTVVVYPQGENVLKVIEDRCKEQNAVMINVELPVLKNFDLDRQVFDYKNHKDIEISLLGEHQIYNAATAIETLETLGKTDTLRAGFKKATWAGRMEIVSRDPLFFLDGAHNAQGAEVLAKNLKLLCPNEKFTFIVGVLAHKNYQAMLESFYPLASAFITVTPNFSDKGLDAQDLATYIKQFHNDVTPATSVANAIDIAKNNNNTICAFGSLYYIGEVRDYFGL